MPDDGESLDDLFRDLIPPTHQTSTGPFKFLDPYGRTDRDIFFGRDAEIAELYRKFFKAPLLLVYGPSGTGKTSLVQCGLCGEIPSEDLLLITVRSAREPLAALRHELLHQLGLTEPQPRSLTELLAETVQRKSKTLALFLDQFEELFLFQSQAVRDEFVAGLRDWLASGIKLHVIIGIREEYLAQLTELEAQLPGMYENRVWVRRMGREQAREAIVGPCQARNIEIDPQLVEELLDELVLGEQEVELPILQVVLDTLYRHALERAPQRPSIIKADYLALGRTSAILAGFIQDHIDADDDPDRARQVLKAMITPAGTRQLGTLEEIITRADQFGKPLDRDLTSAILNRLIDGRIVRTEGDGKLYELRHDSLAKTVLQWMSGMEKELAEVRQMLEHRLQESRSFGGLLSESVLNHVEPYLGRLRLTHELQELVQRSRKTLHSRKMRLMGIGMLVLTAVLITVALLGWRSQINFLEAETQRVESDRVRRVAEGQRNEARRNLAAALFEKAQRFFDVHRYNEAAICAAEAWVRDPSQYYPGLVQDEGLLTPLLGFMQADQALIAGAVFNPDGSRLYTADYDKQVRQWDPKTQTQLGVVASHTDGLRRIALADQGRTLISADYAGIIKITRLGTGKKPRTLTAHAGNKIYSLGVDEAHGRIVSGDESGIIQVWDIGQGVPILSSPLDIKAEVMAAAFTPDGRQLVSASATNGPLTLWQLDTGERHDLVTTLPASIWDLAITPDGQRLITADRDGVLATWNLRTQQPLSQWTEPSTEFLTVTYLPQRHWIATGERRGRLKLWTDHPANAPTKITDIRAHTTGIRQVAWSPHTSTLATVSPGGEVKLWRPAAQTDSRPWSGHNDGITDMDLSSDGRYLVTAGLHGIIRKWDAASGALLAEHQVPGQPRIAKVAFRPGTTQIAVIHGATFSLLDSDWQSVFSYRMDNNTTIQAAIVFTSDGGKVLLPLQVNRFNLLDLDTGHVEREFEGHDKDLYSLAISDHDDLIASGSVDKAVLLWDLNDGHLHETRLPHTGQIRSMDIHKGILVTGTEGGYLTVWQLDTNDEIHQFQAFQGQINALRLSPDGRQIAAGGTTGIVTLWNTHSGKLLATLHGHGGGITALRFSPDGSTLYSTGKGGTIHTWDLQQIHSNSAEDYLRHIRQLTGLKSDGIDVVPLKLDEWQALAP